MRFEPYCQEIRLIGALSNPEIAARLVGLGKLRWKLLADAAEVPRQPAGRPRRIGEISRAITDTLTEAAEPMHVSEIHHSVERLLGHPVSPRSIKGRLSEGTLLRKPRFERTGYGYYRLRAS